MSSGLQTSDQHIHMWLFYKLFQHNKSKLHENMACQVRRKKTGVIHTTPLRQTGTQTETQNSFTKHQRLTSVMLKSPQPHLKIQWKAIMEEWRLNERLRLEYDVKKAPMSDGQVQTIFWPYTQCSLFICFISIVNHTTAF